LNKSTVRSAVTLAVVSAGVIPLVTFAAPAQATVAGTPGLIAVSGGTYTTGGTQSASLPGDQPAWSPDGSRVAVTDYQGIVGLDTLTAAGTDPVTIPITPIDDSTTEVNHPTYYLNGQYIAYGASEISNDQIYLALSDGAAPSFPLFTDPTGSCDFAPSAGPGGVLVFQRTPAPGPQEACPDGSGSSIPSSIPGSEIMGYNAQSGTASVITEGSEPDVSPDGTEIAFVRSVTAPGATTAYDQIFTANIDGTDVTQVTDDTANDEDPAWSPDGQSLLFGSVQGQVWSNDVPLTEFFFNQHFETTLGIDGTDPAWQPVNSNHVVRLWGEIAIDTAIAVSQDTYLAASAPGSATAHADSVVLTRSDGYYDALAGTSLAVAKQGPLLLTPPSSLNPDVAAEIQRVLKPGGTVYLLGGTAALSTTVQDAVEKLGYNIDRLAGSNMYGTAIAIAHAVNPSPSFIMVATGTNYYDALTAGAAAAQGGVLVLSHGTSLAPETVSYLNGFNPADVAYWAIGGPASAALQNSALKWSDYPFYAVVGNNAMDTALLVAQYFFVANTRVAVATMHGWYDALSGGAAIGHDGGPLLLTEPTGLYGPDAAYLSTESGSLNEVDMLGGPAALPAGLIAQLGDAISLPGQWDYTSFEPGGTPPDFPLPGIVKPTASIATTHPSGAVGAAKRPVPAKMTGVGDGGH
jgi:ell wall binding domain 2 (CWB2)/WD40-like Beta Propeller Repeat